MISTSFKNYEMEPLLLNNSQTLAVVSSFFTIFDEAEKLRLKANVILA